MSERAFLRHTLATLAYRGGKVVRGAPTGFESFRVGESSRTPAEVLAHVGDLLDWAVSMATGEERWHDSKALPWDGEVQRFFDGLSRFDAVLASEQPLSCSLERLFQGPIADALTHVGQIGMLRRLANAPVRGENYSQADINAGQVGPSQPRPSREFD